MLDGMRRNVSEIVKDGLCTSCGICQGACPHSCITFHYGKERNTPYVDEAKCTHCGLCNEICPGKGIKLVEKGRNLFEKEDGAGYNKSCGYYLNSYTGYSNDEDIRYHSASGGMVTSFLIYLLEQKIIDGALVVGYKEENPFEPEPFIATSKSDLLRSRGSKYLVLSYDKAIQQVIDFKGKLAVVGLPCHIQGMRNLAEKNKKVRNCVVGYFSIYCSLNKTKHSMDYYLDKYNINRNDVGYFSFRDDGCLGYMKFVDKGGGIMKKIPYLSFWFGTHSFFQNKRCLLCADHFGELADISFGDINTPPYNQDKIGISSMVIRSNMWNQHLMAAYKAGYVTISPCAINDVIKSQGYSRIFKKGKGILSYMKVRKIVGLKNPEYDVEFEGVPTIKNYIQVIFKYLMLSIGANRCFWFIIKMFDKSDR